MVGITFEAGEGGRVGDNIRLRGFTVAGDIYLDGMRDIAQYNRDTAEALSALSLIVSIVAASGMVSTR